MLDQIEEFKKIKTLPVEDPISLPVNNPVEYSTSCTLLTPEKNALTLLDSERMRLLELLAVVNRRLDESRRLQMEAESQLKKEKFRSAKLEMKIARLELERVGVLKTGRGSYAQHNNKYGDFSQTDPDEVVKIYSKQKKTIIKMINCWFFSIFFNNNKLSFLQTRQHIEYLEEECLALKTRIETLQMEKEDDLKVFAAITDMRHAYVKKTNNCSVAKVNSPKDVKSTNKILDKRRKKSQTKVKKEKSGKWKKISNRMKKKGEGRWGRRRKIGNENFTNKKNTHTLAHAKEPFLLSVSVKRSRSRGRRKHESIREISYRLLYIRFPRFL